MNHRNDLPLNNVIGSRAIQEANDRRARIITFYKNGEPYSSGLRVSVIPGRDFKTLEQLCIYLTEKTNLNHGVRYIFSLNGTPVFSLNELEHGQAYVISGSKQFQRHSYGNFDKRNNESIFSRHLHHPFDQKADLFKNNDIKLLRPLSSRHKYNNTVNGLPISKSISYREGRIITIINNKDHSLKSRVLLNLSNPKPFEEVLKDLGQAVRIKNAKRMFTVSGQEVRSVSQLKRDMIDVDLFYLDTTNTNIKSLRSSTKNQITKSQSLESILNQSPNKHESANKKSIENIQHSIYQSPRNSPRDSPNEIQSEIQNDIQNEIQNEIRKTDSTPDLSTSLFGHNFESIPSRHHESNSKFTLNSEQNENVHFGNPINGYYDVDDVKDSSNAFYKTSETQTSPDFVRISRRHAKKLNKLKSRESSSRTTDPEVHESSSAQEIVNMRKSVRTQGNMSSQSNIRNYESSSAQEITNMRKSVMTQGNMSSQSNIRNYESGSAQEITNMRRSVMKQGNMSSKSNIRNYSRNKSDSESAKLLRQFNHSSSSSNKDAIQEYAEQLLKETAFNLQNEQFRRDSIEKSVTNQFNNSMPNHHQNRKPNKSNKSIESRTGTRTRTRSRSRSRSIESPSSEIQSNLGIIADNNNNNKENLLNSENVRVSPVKATELKQVPYEPNIVNKEEARARNLELINQEYLESLRDGNNIPDKNMKLRWVHGYNGKSRNNLLVLPNGELVFFIGSIGVVWHPDSYAQKLYTKHTFDIQCMALHGNSEVVATAQNATNKSTNVIVHIWSSISLKTLNILSKPELGHSVFDISFTKKGFLVVLNYENQINITIWNWKKAMIITRTNKPIIKGEMIYGVLVHSEADDIMVTYGDNHLCMWERKSDGSYYNRPAVKPTAKFAKCINCVVFLNDESLLTGDTSGTLTIWAPNENQSGQIEFVVKEVRGHEFPLTVLYLMANNILISGDEEGTVKTWDVNEGQFRLLNAIKLPVSTGSITGISMAKNENFSDSDALDIYIGTSMNYILKGSALKSTNYSVILEGHSLGIRGLAADPKENTFYSTGLDHKICKWNEKSLIWKTTTQFQCVSSAMHPSGLALATGSVNGTIFILSSQNGNIISQLPISNVCIGCLSFSPDGDLLAAGCQDGIVYLLPVYENGFSYEKVSVLKGPYPILSLQWSLDSQYILTSVNDKNYQEIILWDLINTRYMKGAPSDESLVWKDATCSGGEDVRGIWDNIQLENVVNLSCHCSPSRKYIVSGDEEGHIRLFGYPCQDFQAAFFEHNQGSGGVTEVRFLSSENYIVSTSFDGALFVWELISVSDITKRLKSNDQIDDEK